MNKGAETISRINRYLSANEYLIDWQECGYTPILKDPITCLDGYLLITSNRILFANHKIRHVEVYLEEVSDVSIYPPTKNGVHSIRVRIYEANYFFCQATANGWMGDLIQLIEQLRFGKSSIHTLKRKAQKRREQNVLHFFD